MILAKHVKWNHRINEFMINEGLIPVLQNYLSILYNFLVIIFTYITCMYSKQVFLAYNKSKQRLV